MAPPHMELNSPTVIRKVHPGNVSVSGKEVTLHCRSGKNSSSPRPDSLPIHIRSSLLVKGRSKVEILVNKDHVTLGSGSFV